MRSNIFDNMLAMMEKYANNLETLVDERTHLLIEEKQKTEDLLHLMLPKPVAEQLKQVCFVFLNGLPFRGRKVDIPSSRILPHVWSWH